MRSCSITDERTFLKFFLNYAGAMQFFLTIVGSGHPDLIHLMKYGACPMFVDCTFSCVPRGFKQLLIIMIYTAATGMYVRCVVQFFRLSENFEKKSTAVYVFDLK